MEIPVTVICMNLSPLQHSSFSFTDNQHLSFFSLGVSYFNFRENQNLFTVVLLDNVCSCSLFSDKSFCNLIKKLYH